MTYALWVERLGADVFFVPCEPGTKKPVVGYVGRVFNTTKSPAYVGLFELHGANIAVYLGAASGGLCAIDFDENSDLAAWDALNPDLAGTLRTKGSRGAMVWLRVVGDYPASCSPGHFEWRATNRLATIAGRHSSGVDYQILVDGPVARVPFAQITWPDGWRLPWVPSVCDRLEKEYGLPLTTPARGGVARLNPGFLVGKFLVEHDVLFDAETARFYCYHPATGLWCYLPDAAVQHHFALDARAFVRELEVVNGGEGRLQGVMVQINHPFLRNLAEQLKGAALRDGAFSKPNRVLHAANGMVDLAGGTAALRPFAKSYFSRNQTPIPFQPGLGCPRFIEELLAPALDAEDIDLLQQWCGLALLGRNYCQVMMILSGTAAGGKGTIVNVINGVIGETNVHQLRTEHLDSRFETSFYLDKTLLYGADVEPNFLNTTSAHFLKSLTGDDLLTTEAKRSMVAARLRGDFNIIVTCNSRLMVKLQGDAEAWARRLLLIEFSKPPPVRRIPHFDRILLKDEGPGILNWMLEGSRRVLASSDAADGLLMTPAQRQRVSDLLSESDAARMFIVDGVQRSPFVIDNITTEELYRSYLGFCDGHGWTAMSQRAFEMKAKDLMTQIHRACPTKDIRRDGDRRQLRGFTCVTLKTVDEVAPGCQDVNRSDGDPY